jgi:teichuronic acid biosynthesis glycosyltransferase TuaC
MKILFISSGNHSDFHHGTKDQINSLAGKGIKTDVYLIRGKGFLGYLKNIREIKTTINKGSYDVIHAIGGHSGLAVILTMNIKNLCVSYLGSDIQGDYSPNFFKNFHSRIIACIVKISSFAPNKIIVKSKRMMLLLPNKVKKKCHVVPNGVDFGLFKPLDAFSAKKHLSLEIKKKYILFLGNTKKHNKNFKLLAEAFKLLKDKSNIELLTPFLTPHTLIPYYLNACDVLVLTSFKEGSPNIIKEAMACSCPIIATDVGDSKEIIGDTINCYITNFNPIELSILLTEVLTKSSKTNGRGKIQHLCKQNTANTLKKIYNETINNQNAYKPNRRFTF